MLACAETALPMEAAVRCRSSPAIRSVLVSALSGGKTTLTYCPRQFKGDLWRCQGFPVHFRLDEECSRAQAGFSSSCIDPNGHVRFEVQGRKNSLVEIRLVFISLSLFLFWRGPCELVIFSKHAAVLHRSWHMYISVITCRLIELF